MRKEETGRIKVSTLQVGDVIGFRLCDGEDVQAMAVQKDSNGMVFCLTSCLAKSYPMHITETNEVEYEQLWLQKQLNNEILALFPEDIRNGMISDEYGAYLRLPREMEIFGNSRYGDGREDDPIVTQQWKPMEQRKNRAAIDKDGHDHCYWLHNKAYHSNTCFTFADPCNGNGKHAMIVSATFYNGVRPVFMLDFDEDVPVSNHEGKPSWWQLKKRRQK